MADKLNRRLIVSIGGAVVLIAAATILYIMFLGPQMKEWQAINREIKDRRAELVRLQKAFGNQEDPKAMLRNLRQENRNLAKANAALSKIKRPGTEMKDMPPEIMDPDLNIRKALFDQYTKMLMESELNHIEAALLVAMIDPPEIKLHTGLKDSNEVPYYINRKTGLQGIVNALIKTQANSDSKILLQELELEDYAKGILRRKDSQNVLSYFMVMTMDMNNLVSFIYNLNEEEGYYYVEKITVKPATRQRFGGQDAKLLVDARINTVLIYQSQVLKDIKRAVEKSESQAKRTGKPGQVGGFLALAAGIQKTTDKEVERKANKKWYEFWK